VISCANKRLLKMNGGRYALDCRDLGQGKGNAYIGLDLDVKDMVSSQMRDVKSLSGGESFLASLSMALGMADLIRMQRGRVQLETMFIDEGFGSLSDDVRSKAVEVLNELSGGKSLIGIISHVSELKSQIDTQLLVTKDAGGSHARWTGDGGETI
jgi:exonuclease SbcC